MSAQTKSRAKKLGKAVGIALFVFLMFFNIKIAVSDNSSGDIDLFGLKLEILSVETYAEKEPPSSYCYILDHRIPSCYPPKVNCLCDVIIQG